MWFLFYFAVKLSELFSKINDRLVRLNKCSCELGRKSLFRVAKRNTSGKLLRFACHHIVYIMDTELDIILWATDGSNDIIHVAWLRGCIVLRIKSEQCVLTQRIAWHPPRSRTHRAQKQVAQFKIKRPLIRTFSLQL